MEECVELQEMSFKMSPPQKKSLPHSRWIQLHLLKLHDFLSAQQEGFGIAAAARWGVCYRVDKLHNPS